jgi:hypothetical protein
MYSVAGYHGAPWVQDIMKLHVCRFWISCCYMCAGAGYHGSGARDGEADDRRGRDKRKAGDLSILTDPSGMLGYPNQSVRRLAPFPYIPYTLFTVHTVAGILNSLRRAAGQRVSTVQAVRHAKVCRIPSRCKIC